MLNALHCRFCGTPLRYIFADLGMSPLSNAYLRPDALQRMEPFYPLTACVCERCCLVQLPAVQTPEHIFSEYAYFSSYSDTWLKHAEVYTDQMMARFGFNTSSQVIEIASNDGYLLRYFKAKGLPVLGVEPAANVARVAQAAGIPTLVRFFGVRTARELVDGGTRADLLLGNNVLAHVPDLNDFVAGMKIALKPEGVFTMEFPHLMRVMAEHQFDTIYHEHFSYFSFFTVEQVFAGHGLTLFDVEELPTHGGSLRIYGRHAENRREPLSLRIKELRDREIQAGCNRMETYTRFAANVRETKRRLLAFLISAKDEGKSIVGYGAPAKGNTLLNYCGIGADFLDYTVDRSPHKQGLFLPGTHLAIYAPERVRETKPHYLLILPWNLKQEIIEQMAFIREWGGQFVVPIPSIEVIP